MYTPAFNTVDDPDDIRAMVGAARSAWLVTVGDDGVPVAALLPILWRGERVIAHMAKANRQWRDIADDSPALLIVGGPEAYVSPSWYAAKAEHGKVVPTWNYSAVHLAGKVRIREDTEWIRRAVTDLTDAHESGREHRWRVSDAPEPYIQAQLNGIVGIDFTVTSIEAKAKLSQNRSDADQLGVIEGLRADRLPPYQAAGAADVAGAMSRGRRGGS